MQGSHFTLFDYGIPLRSVNAKLLLRQLIYFEFDRLKRIYHKDFSDECELKLRKRIMRKNRYYGLNCVYMFLVKHN